MTSPVKLAKKPKGLILQVATRSEYSWLKIY